MHPCLEMDEILDMILLKLSLRRKFTALVGSRKWRQKIVVFLLRQHKSVELLSHTPYGFYIEHQCKNHSVTQDNVITSKLYHTDFRKAMLSFLSSIEFVYLDTSSNGPIEIWYPYYKNLLQHMIHEYGLQLKCLWIPQH